MSPARTDLRRALGSPGIAVSSPWPRYAPKHRAVGPVRHAADRTDGSDGVGGVHDTASAVDAERTDDSAGEDPVPLNDPHTPGRRTAGLDRGLAGLHGAW